MVMETDEMDGDGSVRGKYEQGYRDGLGRRTEMKMSVV